VLSPSSAAEAAEAAESSRRQQMIDAATAAAGISPMIIILAICGVFVALAALYVCFHNKKHSAAASVENRSDLEQPKMVVELTVNPMKEAK
jgi:flagellar basal body-associated protein FliL